MASSCDVCGKPIRALGFYPLRATVNAHGSKEVTLCSAICLIRLIQTLRRGPQATIPDSVAEPAGWQAARRNHGTECWILVVDDDDEIREVVSEVLVERGYQAVAVADGQQALSCLQSAASPPCLILLDIMMPVMDGVAFRRQQLTDPQLAPIPVAVVSAVHPPDHDFQGAVMVHKPLQLQTLLRVVAERCPPRYLGPRGLPA
jgi:CheY-like chemotaxis protein